jgi:hypothetical protein
MITLQGGNRSLTVTLEYAGRKGFGPRGEFAGSYPMNIALLEGWVTGDGVTDLFVALRDGPSALLEALLVVQSFFLVAVGLRGSAGSG